MRKASWLVGLVLVAAVGGCATADPDPRAPVARDEGREAELPPLLRGGASGRYAGRALPAVRGREFAMARIGRDGRRVRVAIGDFTGPVVVVDEGRGDRPRLLLEGGNVRLLVEVARHRLREVALDGALLVASHRDADASATDALVPSVRLPAGAPVARLARADSARYAGAVIPAARAWVRYADDELEAFGLIDEQRLGRVYRPGGAPEPQPTDAEVTTPIEVLDRPGGRALATIRRGAGPRVPVARLLRRGGHVLVRAALSRGLIVTGWVPLSRVEPAAPDVPAAQAPAPRGHWLSLADAPDRARRCVELAAATRLHARPRGPVTGLVTRADRFVLLGRADRAWLRIGVGHPLGMAPLWVADRAPRLVPCDGGGRPGGRAAPE